MTIGTIATLLFFAIALAWAIHWRLKKATGYFDKLFTTTVIVLNAAAMVVLALGIA